MPETGAQTTVPTPQEQILGIVNNHWQSRCVGAAAQLELADHLANGPLHVDVLAERTQTHAPSLYRMLRALESTGIFAQSSPRVFANTPQSECLRRYATLAMGMDSYLSVSGFLCRRRLARADAGR